MAQTNTKTNLRSNAKTHEGARAMTEKPLAALERVLNAHMLWEDRFYLNGVDSAKALADAVLAAVKYDAIMTGEIILTARHEYNIRHASLYAAVLYAEAGGVDGRNLVASVISRADELAEVLSMAGGKNASHAVMKGVRDAFAKFDEYQFGKYKGEGRDISLRDAVFLTHPNPKKVPLVQKIVDGTLSVPDTWETGLSAGKDKKAVFEGLLAENKLGAMALLRNLRNMEQAGVNEALIVTALENANWSRVLPFRFLTAALTAPRFARQLDTAFQKAVSASNYFPGATAVLVDTSASMTNKLSSKSIVNAIQAGATLAAAVNGDKVDLYEWASDTRAVANWQSLSTALSLGDGAVGHGTRAVQAVNYANRHGNYARIILISDMQFHHETGLPTLKPGQRGYSIDLSPYRDPGLMVGDWTHFTGFSTAVLKYMALAEQSQ